MVKTNVLPKNIIIIQHMGLGDLVACEPLSRYLKTVYPSSNVIWVCPKNFEEIIDTNPYIDHAIKINNFLEFYYNIKPNIKNTNTMVIDLTGLCNPKVNFLNYYYFGGLLEAFSLSANLPKICEQPNVYINDVVKDRINKVNLPEKFISVHRFSKGLLRSIDCTKWDKILEYIVKKYKYKIIEVGGQDIKEIPEPNIPKSYYLDLRGKLSILETAEVIKRADYFIGVDSGPTHLANAVKTKGVILLGVWMGRFKKYIPYCGFYRDKKNVRYARNENGPVRDISVEKVIDAIESIINNLEYSNEIEPYDIDGDKLIENFLNSSDSFIIWGASGAGLIYKNLLDQFGKKVVCFIDSNMKKNNTVFQGIPVFHHSKLIEKELKHKQIIIASTFWQDISDTLETQYNKKILIDYI